MMDDVQIAGGMNACDRHAVQGAGHLMKATTTTTILENINPPKTNNNAKWRYKRNSERRKHVFLEQRQSCVFSRG